MTKNNAAVQFKTKSLTSNTIIQSLVFVTIITSRENLAQQSVVIFTVSKIYKMAFWVLFVIPVTNASYHCFGKDSCLCHCHWLKQLSYHSYCKIASCHNQHHK